MGSGRVLYGGSVWVGVLVLLAATVVPAATYPRPGTTERVSVASDGTQGQSDPTGFGFWNAVDPAVSAGGRFVAFESLFPNLVPEDDNGVRDIFVHDRDTGVTERVSVASDGTDANNHSFSAAISADGRYVGFHSWANNLVDDDTNDTTDVFVHDRLTRTTERVSVASGGTEGNGVSQAAALSANGRYVAFKSRASNLVAGDTNDAWDVFVHDRDTGTTERVSVASDGTQGDGASEFPAISGDARYVAFESAATNLVAGDTNAKADVFVRDREAGTTQRVSVATGGAQGNDESRWPALSADGRFVTFTSRASNLVPRDTNGTLDVFVHDRDTGVTERVSVASDGSEAGGPSSISVLSADGRYVAFNSSASDLVPGVDPNPIDVFVHDRATGATEHVAVSSTGVAGNRGSRDAALSADGRYVAFESSATNLVPGDTNGAVDVFVRDRGPGGGVGGLAVQAGAGEVTVAGWATFSGQTVASAADPTGGGVDALGAEIAAASVVHRPEQEDVLLRLGLASLPDGGGPPGVLYRWSFSVGDAAYEVRALRAAATAVPPTSEPHFALYACATTCEEVAALRGGIGTTGAEVRVAVPLDVLGAEDGVTLTDVEVAAALGEAAPGGLVVLHEVELPDADLAVPRVDLAVAAASTPEGEVAFDTAASLTDGAFAGTVATGSLPAGDYRLWARACLGEVCGMESIGLTL